MKVKLLVAILILALPGLSSMPGASAFSKKQELGLFSCFKPKNYAYKGALVKSFNKSFDSKNSNDWFNTYSLARLYTGNPNCFKSSEVATMRKVVTAVNNACATNPNWQQVCYVAGGTGPLASWVYENAK